MTNLTVALDIMGGDRGPLTTLSGAKLALEKVPDLHLILCGDAQHIHTYLKSQKLLEHPRISVSETTQVVAMDDKPAAAIRTKKDSSMRRCVDLVQQGEAQACVSAGNTGALFSIAHFVLKTLPGVFRPALISALPTHVNDKHVFMLDLGANVFCDSETLYQFAVMGSIMASEVDGIEKPRVSLLNMGEEDIKGSDHIKQAAAKLKECSSVNYTGFIEGNHIFSGKTDVIVCDGFVGNVALKTCEGIAYLVADKLKQLFKSTIMAQIVSFLFLPAAKKMLKRLNPDQYNGASLIGLRGIVVKSHGNADSKAFCNAILEAVREVERQVPEKIKATLEQELGT